MKYAIRLPANDNLERDIAELLTRPVGRPSYKPVVWFKLMYRGSNQRQLEYDFAVAPLPQHSLSPTIFRIAQRLPLSSLDRRRCPI